MASCVTRATLVLTAAALTMAARADGIAPRGSSAAYAARGNTPDATIAASVIPPAEVKKLFATDLNHAGYVVIEVAVYPEPGKQVNIAESDFMLRASEGSAVRSATGETIAAVLGDKNVMKDQPPSSRSHGVDVYPTANVGYERGTDPYSGRRVGGAYGGAGVGVGVGGNGP